MATAAESESTSDSTSGADTTGGSATSLPPATVTPTSPGTTGLDPSTETGLPEPSSSSSDASTGPLPPFPGEPDVQVNVSCDVWDPVCPETEKCIAWSNDESGIWNDARCTGVGLRDVGEPCSVQDGPTAGIDNCVLGAMCWGVDPETNDGHCIAQCRGSENAPVCDSPSTACVIGNDGSLNVCAPTCDPLNQRCAEDEACYGDLDSMSTVCLRPGTPLVSGPDLATPALCPPGSTAVPPERDVNCEDAELCCVLWCDPGLVPDACPSDTDCHLWNEEGSVVGGYNEPGVCLGAP